MEEEVGFFKFLLCVLFENYMLLLSEKYYYFKYCEF